MKTILKVDNLEKFYKNKGSLTKAVNHISFEVQEGEYLGIMGASGSGKTTLLNCISTVDHATAGHIYVNGKDVTDMKETALARFRREELGFIFQSFNLLDTLTGRDNIALALAILGEHPKKIDGKINKIAQELGIGEILEKYPYEMSGGQQQRVAIARALASKPAIVLADEPTGNLDTATSHDVLGLLRVVAKQYRQTIILITHDQDIAQLADRIVRIEDGRIVKGSGADD